MLNELGSFKSKPKTHLFRIAFEKVINNTCNVKRFNVSYAFVSNDVFYALIDILPK